MIMKLAGSSEYRYIFVRLHGVKAQKTSFYLNRITDMRRLTTGIRSEKYVVRRFRCCTNVIECTYTKLDSIACYTPRLYGIAYCS